MIDFLIDNWFWFLIFSGTISKVVSNIWKEICKVFKISRTYEWEELQEMGYSPLPPPALKQQRSKPSPRTDWDKYRINKVGGGIGKSYDVDAMEKDRKAKDEEVEGCWDDGRSGVDPKTAGKTNQLKKGNVGTANLKEW